MNEQFGPDDASQMANDLLGRAGGQAFRRLNSPSKRTVCLSLSHQNRGDMPSNARITLMSESVARALAVFGLQAPVSLTHLAGLFWVARVDAGHIYDSMEFGGSYCIRVASTEELIWAYSDGYAEVTRGPFATEEEAAASLNLG